MLRAIISSISANLSVQPGVAPTYRRALGRCWAGFWAVVGLDGLLNLQLGASDCRVLRGLGFYQLPSSPSATL